jgi:hypothetical protein
MERPKYSADIIRRYREMDEANAFRREVKERVPVDLDYDQVTFSCGHQQEFNHGFFQLMPDGKFHCETCKKEWLAKAVEEGKTK